ncbi:hypothetical protein WA026_020672 [Henosepilachna vigintioctopunctata]|uniref:Breast cancer type 2 susceptibility protein n=1 Tax=Henosepilachna vigintioctopunctata TaxID=420089 RepID=A0AAW1U4Z6_9CUCU
MKKEVESTTFIPGNNGKDNLPKVDFFEQENVMYLKGGGFIADQREFPEDLEMQFEVMDAWEYFNHPLSASIALIKTEWCATKTDLIDASTTQQRETSQEAEVNPTCRSCPSVSYQSVYNIHNNEYSQNIKSYAQIDDMLDKMLNEVELIDCSSKENCFNSLTLEPSSDALIEIPIKKLRNEKTYTTEVDIFVSEDLEEIAEPEDSNHRMKSLKDIHKNKGIQNNLKDYYEPIDFCSEYQVNDKDGIWWEGTYRNLGVVLEEDEENLSQSSCKKNVKSTHQETPDFVCLKQRFSCENEWEQENSEICSDSTQIHSSISTDDSDNENICNKAEIKVLIKSKLGEANLLDIDAVKGNIFERMRNEIGHEHLGKFREYNWDERNHQHFNTLPRRNEENRKLKIKPSFTLPRLFLENTEVSSNCNKNDNSSRPNHNIIAKPNENFPLSFDHTKVSSENLNIDLYANIPFYPTYESGASTSSPRKTQYIPPTEVTLSEAYCNWTTEIESLGQTTSPQYLDKLETKLLDKTCVVKFPNIEIEIAYDFEQTLRETNAFLKYECQAEPYDAWTDNRYKDIKSEIEYSPNTTPTKKRRKKGIFETLKSLVTKSTENLSSEPEGLSPKSDRTDRKKKTFLVTSGAISKNTEQIETPSHKESSHGHDEICEYRSEKDFQNDRAEIQKMFSESATSYQAERKDSDHITVGTTVKENVSSERQEEKTSEKGNILKIVDDSKDGFSKELDRSVNNSTQEKFSLDRGATIDGIYENLKHDSDVTATRPLSCKDGKEDFKIERNAEISDAERPTPQTSKKPGIWSFLTKKSKKSTAVGNEENVEKILEKNGDELNVTQLFLEQEQNNYYCGSRHANIEDHQNVLSDLDKNQTKIKSMAKAGICESFLSKLKPSDAALIDPEEASYIKFDEDDLIYDPVTTVIHEKQKKVTFDEKAPEEILPADTSIDEPAAKRLICRLKEMNADDQLINKQDSIERDSDCSRKIRGIIGRENKNLEFDYPDNCLEQEVAYTINMIDQTDRFLETEKVLYQGEIISSMKNIKQGECGPKELPKPALDEQCRKYQSPLKEKEVLRDIASTRTEMSQDDHSKSAASIIDELYNKDMSTLEQPDQDFIDLTDLFLKKEIDEYSDVKLAKLTTESSSLDQIPKKNENSKSKRFFVLSSKKRKIPKESLVPRRKGKPIML